MGRARRPLPAGGLTAVRECSIHTAPALPSPLAARARCTLHAVPGPELYVHILVWCVCNIAGGAKTTPFGRDLGWGSHDEDPLRAALPHFFRSTDPVFIHPEIQGDGHVPKGDR